MLRRNCTLRRIAYYLASSGTGGAFKYFPESEVASRARQMAINVWNMIVMQREPVMTSPDVKMLAVVNNTPIESAPNGKPVRRASGNSAKSLWERFPAMYVHPYELLECSVTADVHAYLLALYLLREPRFNLAFCNNPAYFGVLLDTIDAHATQLIADVRAGGASVPLTEAERAALAPTLAPDPARADELDALLAADGRLVPAKVWPEFVLMGTWLAGSAGIPFAQDTRARLPKTLHYLSEPYGASEGMFTIPLGFGDEGGPLATWSCYFEFLPLDAAPGTRPLSMDEVQVGAHYELVVTTYSGLYRYNLHDIVRVDGRVGDTPVIAFCCRSSDCVTAGGERHYAYELFPVMAETCQRTRAVPCLFQGVEESGSLSILVEFYEPPTNAAAFRDTVETLLASAGIPFGRLYVMQRGWRQALYDARKQNGRTEQTIKLSPIAHEVPLDRVERVL